MITHNLKNKIMRKIDKLMKIRLREILARYKNVGDHYADQEYSEDNIIEAMKVACERTVDSCNRCARVLIHRDECDVDDESILRVKTAIIVD